MLSLTSILISTVNGPLTSLVSLDGFLWWVLKHIRRRRGLVNGGGNRMRASDPLMSLFFLLSMGVGIPSFKHINPP